ncbi:MAG: DUF2924 domain-containing protein [Clostridia bacterium]|nr:DUF2924 domain-containing protein [Clostridia bacterium]
MIDSTTTTTAHPKPLAKWTRAQADAKIKELHTMSTSELTQLWAILFGCVCYTRRKAFIRRRLEWRINTLVSGGISERAMKRAEEIADDTLLRVKSRAFTSRNPEPEAKPASAATAANAIPQECRITRKYKGVEHTVFRKDGAFIYNGHKYATLSEVSTIIAGYYVSGNKFFNITQSQLNATEQQQ